MGIDKFEISDYDLKEFKNINKDILMLPIIVDKSEDIFKKLYERWDKYFD